MCIPSLALICEFLRMPPVVLCVFCVPVVVVLCMPPVVVRFVWGLYVIFNLYRVYSPRTGRTPAWDLGGMLQAPAPENPRACASRVRQNSQ